MWAEREGTESYPLDYPRTDSGYGALDSLVSWCAEHKGTARVDWGEERIAVFEAVLEVDEGLVELLEEPVEFALLEASCGVD
jgi:hypothetical protein